MIKYGLLGKDISYSFSEKYFANKFKTLQINNQYSNLDYPTIDAFIEALPHLDLRGFNITIPYKEVIIKHLDKLENAAESIGAVNCVNVENQKLIGYNTDILGFQKSIQPLLQPHHTKALVFGNGGASKAIKYVLQSLQISHTFVTRKGDLRYQDVSPEMITEHKLLINTTPVGTFPNIAEVLPLPLDTIGKMHLVFDLVYNPEKTKLLKIAQNKGAIIKNGYEMLEIQAEESWNIWKKENVITLKPNND